jgi:hypothetical protein
VAAVAIALCCASSAAASTASPSAQVRQRLKSYEAAFTTGHGTAACRQMTSGLREKFVREGRSVQLGHTCAVVVHAAATNSPFVGRAGRVLVSILSVDVHGSQAVGTLRERVTVVGQRKRRALRAQIKLVRRDGTWLVAADPAAV